MFLFNSSLCKYLLMHWPLLNIFKRYTNHLLSNEGLIQEKYLFSMSLCRQLPWITLNNMQTIQQRHFNFSVFAAQCTKFKSEYIPFLLLQGSLDCYFLLCFKIFSVNLLTIHILYIGVLFMHISTFEEMYQKSNLPCKSYSS